MPFSQDDRSPRNGPEPSNSGEIVQLITGHQKMLAAYIRTLVFDAAAADDILQETNLLLWEKAHEFELGTNFSAWACKTAYYKVQAYWRDRKRQHSESMDPALMDRVAKVAASLVGQTQDRLDALRTCIEKLSPREQALLAKRYQPGASVTGIAKSLGRSPASLSVSLTRLRHRLTACIESTLASIGESRRR